MRSTFSGGAGARLQEGFLVDRRCCFSYAFGRGDGKVLPRVFRTGFQKKDIDGMERGQGMALKAKIKEKQGISIITLKGHLDSLTVDDLNVEFSKVMRSGQRKILLVMKGVSYVSSAVVRVFLSFNHWASQMGGALKIAEVHPNAMEVFRLLGLHSVLSIYESSEEALKSFR